MKNAVAPRKILEVIVTSVDDALEAEAGGADRLEIVRNLEAGGLTPAFDLVANICSNISIPVRAMLRESSSMGVASKQELDHLCEQARAFSKLRLGGLVFGFIANDQVDMTAMQTILSAAPHLNVTFHRAFDSLSNPFEAILTLKTMAQIDRILTAGGPGSWSSRKLRLHNWQRHAGPQIKLIAGAGLVPCIMADLMADQTIEEVHVGRAARIPAETSGKVDKARVAQLKGIPA